MAEHFATVDDYIASFPDDVQEILQRVREAIHDGIPGADEKIRYGIAAVMLGGLIIWGLQPGPISPVGNATSVSTRSPASRAHSSRRSHRTGPKRTA